MKKKVKIALVSHIIKDDNLGCGALAISNIRLLNEVIDELGMSVEYVIATTDNMEQISLEKFTKYSYEYRCYPRCKQSLKNPMRLLRSKVFDGCDLVINLCGGDGYTDIYSFGRLLAESQLAWVARRNRIPMIYAPQTIGPFESRKGRFVAQLTLKRVHQIFVRDHASFICCKELGIDAHTAEVIDVAFALPYEKLQQPSTKFKIGFNVSGLLYNGGYDHKNYFGLSFDYSSFVHILLSCLKEKEDVEVYLLPHVNSSRSPVEDDYSVCKMLSEKFGCHLAPRYNSPTDAKGFIAGMDMFTGARMHSTIGAISSGVPVIPIAYSRKFNGLYESLQYPWLIDAKEKITAEAAVERFLGYMMRIDQMKRDVKNAESIYIQKLQLYQEHMKRNLQSI